MLSQLVDYHRAESPKDLASHADMAPPVSTRQHTFWRSAEKQDESAAASPSPQPSPSASAALAEPAAAETAAQAADAPAASEASTPQSEDWGGSSDASAYRAGSEGHSASDGIGENSEVTLQGVMLGADAGIAVLEYDGQTYTVGQGEKVGDYQIDDIKADRVTLNRHGQLSQVKISIPKDSEASAAPSLSVGSYPPVLPAPNDVPLPPQPVKIPESGPAASSGLGDSEAVYNITEADFEGGTNVSAPANELTREELDEFTRKGAALLADIRGTEVENGRGIQVKFRNPDNALAKLGMQDGDVVLRINSKTVLGIEDIYNAVLTMRDAPQIDIDLSRNGQPMSLYHRFPER